MKQIQVPWECVTDGKTRQGANFKHLMEELLRAGYSLDVSTLAGVKTFVSAVAFATWFDSF